VLLLTDVKGDSMTKTALITGATSGIGDAAARAFVAAGWRVIATGRRRDRLEALVASVGREWVYPASRYRGAAPLTGDDIAASMLWVAELPPHVNINRRKLMPVRQSFAGFRVAHAG
jgi:NADP-dependent 3-hydroxy acid dehydrogenase YdfG